MKVSILEEQADHLLGSSLMQEDKDHLDALAESLTDKEPSDFLKMDDAKIDKQDVLYELCEASIGVLDGKPIGKMVKKVKSFIKERLSFEE
jgi:hypothetical protein